MGSKKRKRQLCLLATVGGLTYKQKRSISVLVTYELYVSLTDKQFYLFLILNTLLFLARFPVESVNSSLVELLSKGT